MTDEVRTVSAFVIEIVHLVLAGVAFGFVVGGLLLMTGVSL